jgi:four helix bundle protein
MNDEARMTNDELMTKSKTPREQFDEGFWNDDTAPVIREQPSDSRVYDSQLVAAATSVGANYVEADDAVSKKEFLKSIGTCKKEVREAKHFLRMAVCAVPKLKPEARRLWLEARELHLIFAKIWRSGKQ